MESKSKGGAWLAVMVVAVVAMLGMGEASDVVASAAAPKDEYAVQASVMVSAALNLARLEELEDVAPLPPVQSGSTNVEPTAEPTSTEVRDIDLAGESKSVEWASVIKPQDPPAPVVQSQSSPSVEQVVAAASPDDESVPVPDDEPVAPVAPAAPVMRRVIVGYDRTCVNGQCYSTPRYAMVEDAGAVVEDEELLSSEAYSDELFSSGVVSGAFSRLRENKPVRTFIKNRISNMRARRCSRLGCG